MHFISSLVEMSWFNTIYFSFLIFRIFWVDSQKIWSCKYDGSDIEISRSTPFTAYLITVYKVGKVYKLCNPIFFSKKNKK